MINRQASSTSFGRIYLQSAEFTENFWSTFGIGDFDFSEIFEELIGNEDIVFRTLIELKAFRTKVRNHLENKCLSLDPNYTIPYLVDLMTSYYDEKSELRSYIPIVAAKIVIGFVWKNTYLNPLSNAKSYNDIFERLKIAALFILLEQLIRVWEFVELGNVIMDRHGLIQNDIYSEYNTQFLLQGRHEYKVINDAIKQIWLNDNIFHQLPLILSGVLPNGIKLFGDSFLSDIPITNTKFWYHLWSKLQLYRLALKERFKVVPDNNLVGVCLIPSSTIGLLGINSDKQQFMQQAIFDNFWQPDWHRLQINKNYFILQGIIVERPAIRINQAENVFATSAMLIHDSVNALLEHFVHSREGATIYEKYFTNPFESTVINLFRKHDYLAGEVTTSGIWRLDSSVKLVSQVKMPGQIDALIVDHKKKLVIVADCKMLHFPYEINALRNLRSKFTEQDTEEFYRKLRKKVRWIKSCGIFAVDYQYRIMLITNRHIVLPIEYEGMVFSILKLEKLLTEQYSFD